MSNLLDLLNQALGQGKPNAIGNDAFDRIADNATRSELGSGIAEAFRSDQTPPMGDMVSGLFGASDGVQRAGALNKVIAALGAGLASGALAKWLRPGQTQVTPAQAKELPADVVRDVVTEAQARKPELADQLGDFYAQHSGLIKTLGAGALLIALAKMKQNMDGRG
jgi:hypothetical protein